MELVKQARRGRKKATEAPQPVFSGWHLPFRADKAEPYKCSRPLQRAEGAKYESLGRSQAQP
jgi:hypothetical protein